MEFKKATQEDLDFVRLNPLEGAVKNYPYMEVPDDNTIATFCDGKLISVAGLFMKWPGVGLFWLILVNNFRDYVSGPMAVATIKEKMDYLIEKNNAWRVEADIRVDFPAAAKMVEFLGFKRECVREKYYPDKTDAYLYSRIIT